VTPRAIQMYVIGYSMGFRMCTGAETNKGKPGDPKRPPCRSAQKKTVLS